MPTSSVVRPMIYSIAVLITALLTATMLYNSWMLYTFSAEDRHQEIAQLAYQDARFIAGRLEIYQDFLGHWAQQAQVQALFKKADTPVIENWQNQIRQLMPGVLSVSLLDAQGRSMTREAFPPSKQAIENILKPGYLRIQPMPAWLHTAPITGEQHIDLYAEVKDDKEQRRGFLLLNVRLSVLESTFKQLGLARQNQVYARLLDNREQQIWELNDALVPSQQVLFNPRNEWRTTLKIRVHPTSWELEISQPSTTDYSLVIILLISLLVSLLLITGVAFVTQHLLAKDYLSDFEAVKELLHHLAESRPMQDFSLAPRLQETAKVFAAIRPNAEKIQQAHQQLERLSRTDELTQLANRRAYQEALHNAMLSAREGNVVCLLLLDLDGFKRLNDTAGHPVGDKMLKLLATTLSKHSRQKDLCARLGGDEFAALLFGMNQEFVTQWIERIGDSFMRSQQEDFAQYPQCTISFGFTFIHGDDQEEDEERAFRRADHALYDAKKAGKNTFRQG